MLNEKISESTYDEVTTRPKTEISKVILEMIWRPLKIVADIDSEDSFKAKILSAFTQEILVLDPNFTITNFIIPSLAVIEEFPYVKLVSFLYDAYESPYNNNFGEKSGSSLKFNGFLLNAILQFDTNFLDSVINHQCLHKYLTVVGSMINCISTLPKPKENTRFSYVDDNEDSQSDEESDDDEDESPDHEMQSQFERIILLNVIKQLNEENRVNKIVKNIDSILHLPQVIQSICIIAHNLLIYNRSAIHDYRLLDLLAFKPDFIRTLWYTLLTSKSEKNHLYISILSKGIIIRKLISIS